MATKEQYQKHKEKIKARAREYYWSHQEQRKEYTREYYQRNREHAIQYRRDKTARIKAEVLTHYGKGELACVTCRETRVGCLCLDHINNDGYKRRKETGIIGGEFLYRHLKENNYPEGYQTLCMNCNFLKKHSN